MTEHAKEPESFDLGVLVVHGIGDQKQGATLTKWVDALTGWLEQRNQADINAWQAQLRPQVRRAVLRPSDGPAHVELNVSNYDTDQTWLFAEGWWASTFEPPSFGELWSWSFVSVPATAAMHANAMVRSAIQRLRTAYGAQAIYEAVRLAVMVLFLIALVMLSPLILALLTVLLILGLLASALPIDALRTAVAKAQLISIGTIGDTKRLIDSPTQSGAIKSPVADGIAWLRERGCEQVVVIAHSQGAAVSYKALVDLADGLHGPFEPIDSFITVGSGLPKVHALEHLSSPDGAWLRRASIAIPVAAVSGALSLRFLRDTEALAGLIAPALLMLATAITAVVLTLKIERQRLAGQSTAGPQVARALAVGVGVIAAAIAALVVERSVIVSLASTAIAIGVGAVYLVSSREIPLIPNTLATATRRWIDLWASVDPVPAGATRTVVPGRPETWRVTNLGSVPLDHNSYTENPDECLTLIGIELLHQADLGATELDAPRISQNERRWRVGWRSFNAYALAGAAIVFGWGTWHGADDALIEGYGRAMKPDSLLNTWYPGELPGFVPELMTPRIAEIVAAIGYVLIGLIAIQVGHAAWRAWDRAEAEHELQWFDRYLDDAETALPERPVPVSFRVMSGLIYFAWFIALVPRWVLARWQALDLTSWAGLGVIAGLVGVAIAIGALLPELIDRTGVKQRVMKRDTSHIEGLVGYGLYQLHEQRTDKAVTALERALELAGDSGHNNADALGALAKALSRRAPELRAESELTDDPAEATALRDRAAKCEWDALKFYDEANMLDRLVSVRTLVDYAGHLRTIGGARATVIALLRQAKRIDPRHPAIVIAMVAFDIAPERSLDDPVALLEQDVTAWRPADRLHGQLTLRVHHVLSGQLDIADLTNLADARERDPSERTKMPSLETMLDRGMTAPLADTRPLRQRIDASDLDGQTRAHLVRSIERVAGTVEDTVMIELSDADNADAPRAVTVDV